jgi:hypothetical protein
VLRPYSHLNYAWDEPSLPHKLVLSLPGNLVLGTFKLDQVCSSRRHKCLPDNFLLGALKCASSILRLRKYWLHVQRSQSAMQVGTSQVVTVPGSSHYHVRERSLQVVTRAEGPTCVLTVADLQVPCQAHHCSKASCSRHSHACPCDT